MSGLRDRITLRSLAPRDRRALLLGLAVLVPALLYMSAVRPYRAALGELRDRAAAERALLEREEALIATAAAGDSALPLHMRADRAGMRLVRAPNLPLAEAEVTAMLEQLASLSRVLLIEMRGVEPGRTSSGDDVAGTLRPMRLAIRGESDLEGVLLFLQRIESSPLLLRVVELSIEPVPPARGGAPVPNGAVQIGLILEAYTPSEEVTS